MSLVGSLVDLGLGDILQIVSLSRKSGQLLIHSDEGEGRIIFCDGLVQAAYLKGKPEDLRGLLIPSGSVCAEELYRTEQLADERGVPVEQIIPEFTALSQERLESLVREHVESVVFELFSWTAGEFNFEVREQIDARDRGILMPMGINAQFLTMEATRRSDEGEPSEVEPVADTSPSPATDEDPMFSGEADSANPPVYDEPLRADETESAFATLQSEGDPIESDANTEAANPHEVVALAAARSDAPEHDGETPADEAVTEDSSEVSEPDEETVADEAVAEDSSEVSEPDEETVAAEPVAEKPSEAPEPLRADGPACLIAIDPDLTRLEWEKAILAELFPRVHIFQSCESGVARIRQYLSRGETPVILVSVDLPGDRMYGSEGVADFVRRLKILAPSMSVLIASYEDSDSDVSIDAGDAIVTAPHPRFLVNRHESEKLQDVAVTLRAEIGGWLESSSSRRGRTGKLSRTPEPPADAASDELQRLRVLSEQMRDPAMQGDVLSLVLDFAAKSFSRVAMFMVRDEAAIGIAQRGLPSTGGPNDDEIRELEVPTHAVEWFNRVLESDTALRSGPIGGGDRALALRLGRQVPAEAYIAPILSGGRVVALLYTDTLPGGKPIVDTTVLEIALHEAGLALERALLERALSQAVDASEP